MSLFHSNGKEKPFDLTWASIFKVALIVFAIYFFYLTKDVLAYILFGLIISVLLGPAIDFLQKIGFRRGLAVALVYISVFGFIGFTIYSIAPIFIVEIQQFSQNFPNYFNAVSPFLSGLGFEVFQSVETFTNALKDWLVGASGSIVSSLASIFGGIILSLAVFTIAVFFSLEQKGIENLIILLFPKKYENTMLGAWKKTRIKISGWFASRLVGMIAVGMMVFIVCWLAGIRYPILFGFLAGLTDIIPFIGPIACGIFVTLFALLDAWQKAAIIALEFVVINQLENNLILPLVTKKFIDFPPILVLVSILIGEHLFGAVGAILAIPFFGIFYDFTVDYLQRNKD